MLLTQSWPQIGVDLAYGGVNKVHLSLQNEEETYRYVVTSASPHMFEVHTTAFAGK